MPQLMHRPVNVQTSAPGGAKGNNLAPYEIMKSNMDVCHEQALYNTHWLFDRTMNYEKAAEIYPAAAYRKYEE